MAGCQGDAGDGADATQATREGFRTCLAASCALYSKPCSEQPPQGPKCAHRGSAAPGAAATVATLTADADPVACNTTTARASASAVKPAVTSRTAAVDSSLLVEQGRYESGKGVLKYEAEPRLTVRLS